MSGSALASLRTEAAPPLERWYVLIVMCLVCAINIAARYVVTTVLEPIRLELLLTDAGRRPSPAFRCLCQLRDSDRVAHRTNSPARSGHRSRRRRTTLTHLAAVLYAELLGVFGADTERCVHFGGTGAGTCDHPWLQLRFFQRGAKYANS